MGKKIPSIKKMDLTHLIGRKVGSSTLIKEVARGGMGAIFVAYQHTLKRQIAVKILPKIIITSTTAQIFQQEAEAAAILSHPNIIPIYEVGESGDFLFFTMQLVRGKPLSQYIKMAKKNILPSRRTVPLKPALRIICSILDALEYAHSEDIVHRDIKPDNILMDFSTKRPIITDFGVAQVARDPEDGSSVIMGTPRYMAPEQILSAAVDGRADIYAVGTMLLEMLIPVPLFPKTRSVTQLLNLKLQKKDKLFSIRPSKVNPKASKTLDRIVLKALAYEPDRRYATCRDFLAPLQGVLG